MYKRARLCTFTNDRLTWITTRFSAWAKYPASGIQITDETRVNCWTCDQSEQTKNLKLRKSSQKNAPFIWMEGVICSELKGSMSLLERLGNHYIVNFADHRTSYCWVFLKKRKDFAYQNSKHFMDFFASQFNCRIHVLRTDGGRKDRTLDLFLQGHRNWEAN